MILEQQNQRQQQNGDGNIFFKIIMVIIEIACVCAFSLTFGILFCKYSSNPEYYDECEDKPFITLSNIIGFIHLLNAALLALIELVKIFRKTESSCLFYTKCMIAVFSLLLTFYLTTKDNSQCGSLHDLAMAYYIIIYVLIGLTICIVCCTFAKK